MVKGGEFYPVRVRWVGLGLITVAWVLGWVGFGWIRIVRAGFGLDWVRLD